MAQHSIGPVAVSNRGVVTLGELVTWTEFRQWGAAKRSTLDAILTVTLNQKDFEDFSEHDDLAPAR